MADYRYLLWDIDGTVLDFLAAEKTAIRTLFGKYGFGFCSEEKIARYSAINIRYWQALERGEMTKPEILVGRFREFFEKEGLDSSKAEAFNRDYQLALGDTIVFCDDSRSILQQLKGTYVQAAITNGTQAAQKKKLKASGLDRIFDRIFISEEVGAEKPHPAFFNQVIADLQITDLRKALVIGDSLTSDILGGNRAGIDTCWYNPQGKKAGHSVSIHYEIKDLHEIFSVLKKSS